MAYFKEDFLTLLGELPQQVLSLFCLDFSAFM